MLKVEYPCRDIFSSYQNPNKSIITWAEAKKHLHDVRLRRQNQLTININECQKLSNLHKQMFTRQLDSNLNEKIFNNKSIKSSNTDSTFSVNKHSIPRIEYAPIIYRQALPTFEIENSINLKNETPLIRELTEYLTESSSAISNNNIEKNQLIPPKRKHRQRHFSVSPVSSIDKQTNKIYEKWPDYNRISEIVGYRIDPPLSKLSISNTVLPQRKQNKPSGFSAASKQIKNLVNLNPSSMRRQSSKTKKLTKKTDLIPPPPIILDEPLPIISKPLSNNPSKEIKPQLPNLICPSSIIYSNRIQTRQWLIKNHFSSNSIRTLPLL